jgi:hypothetical protein
MRSVAVKITRRSCEVGTDKRTMALRSRPILNRMMAGVMACLSAAGAAPAFAHHSFAMYDQTKLLVLTGVVYPRSGSHTSRKAGISLRTTAYRMTFSNHCGEESANP